MTPRLIEPAQETQPGREHAVRGEEFLIGRGADCDLRLADQDVSRHHCLLRFRGGEAILVDLGSSNGTYVNGQRVVSQATLQSGFEVRVAHYRFLVDLGDLPEETWKSWLGEDPAMVTRKMKPAEKRPPTSALPES